MAIYTVHIPSDATTAEGVAEKAVFVKEGFSFPGFIFTALWLLTKQLWLYALGYVLIIGLLIGAFMFFGWPMGVFGFVQALLAFLIGIEGHEWLRRKLTRRGFTHAGTVSGPSLEECERRFFKDWIAGQEVVPVAASRPATVSAAVPAAPSVLGVFPTPRGS
ncbi:MAG: DUF2628 domain-containing protein [Beijerinckiaceae bacterium]